MLNVKCYDHIEKVRAFAAQIGLADQLAKQLDYLHDYGGGEGREDYCRCDLFEDFAPYSFTFCIYRTEEGKEPKFWMNGGIIYQGPGCPADGSFPSLTVSLAEGTGWFLHT